MFTEKFVSPESVEKIIFLADLDLWPFDFGDIIYQVCHVIKTENLILFLKNCDDLEKILGHPAVPRDQEIINNRIFIIS